MQISLKCMRWDGRHIQRHKHTREQAGISAHHQHLFAGGRPCCVLGGHSRANTFAHDRSAPVLLQHILVHTLSLPPPPSSSFFHISPLLCCCCLQYDWLSACRSNGVRTHECARAAYYAVQLNVSPIAHIFNKHTIKKYFLSKWKIWLLVDALTMRQSRCRLPSRFVVCCVLCKSAAQRTTHTASLHTEDRYREK